MATLVVTSGPAAGQRLEITGEIVIGREGDLDVKDEEVSRRHAAIRPGAQGIEIEDLGSTNGTVVVQPGLPAEDLQPGIAVALVPGAIVDLGEGVTIQVTGT